MVWHSGVNTPEAAFYLLSQEAVLCFTQGFTGIQWREVHVIIYLELKAKSQKRPGLNQDEALQPAAISEIVLQKKSSLSAGNQELGGNGEKNVQKQ